MTAMYAMSATFTPPPASTVASPFARRPDNRHSQLLTPISHFPSRMLPPPGTTAPSFASGPMVAGTHCIPIGTPVQVRRFNVRERVWMNWIPGRIVEHRVERFHVGREMDLYDVETSSGGQSKIDTYIPFLGELRDGRIFNPSDSVKEMLTKVAEMKKVFACVNVPSGDFHSVPAWVPACITSKRVDPETRVRVLAGPLEGCTDIPAPHILPYNTETAEAIRKTGQLVYWEDGSI